VGFVFTSDDPYFGGDLDKCLDPTTGQLHPWASDILRKFAATYAEISPSGTGVKFIGLGKLPGDPDTQRHKKTYADGFAVELYDAGRFFALTGHVWGDHPKAVTDRQAALTDLYDALFGEDICKAKAAAEVAKKAIGATNDDDAEVVRSLEAIIRDDFTRLYRDGDISGSDNDHSKADYRLAKQFVWRVGPDASRVEALMRTSALARQKYDRNAGAGVTYLRRTIAKAITRTTKYYAPKPRPLLNGKPLSNGKPHPMGENSTTPAVEAANVAAPGSPPPPTDGCQVILEYFREHYRPAFRAGNSIHAADGRDVPMGEACSVACSELIGRLELAADAPRYKGGAVNRNALPGFFKTWAKVAWGDLLKQLPDEDQAELDALGDVANVFRQLVREAMLTEVTLARTVKPGRIVIEQSIERRTLIGWCQAFAQPGPWRSIRGKQCWTRSDLLADGEVVLRVAIRHDVFAQVKADRRLVAMGENKFTRRAKRYGIGSSTREERPHGRAAVVLDPEFVADLISTLPADGAEEKEGE
jgi:hypothetical protein